MEVKIKEPCYKVREERNALLKEVEQLRNEIKVAVLAEREECAALCDFEALTLSDHKSIGAEMCANAIRARGDA